MTEIQATSEVARTKPRGRGGAKRVLSYTRQYELWHEMKSLITPDEKGGWAYGKDENGLQMSDEELAKKYDVKPNYIFRQREALGMNPLRRARREPTHAQRNNTTIYNRVYALQRHVAQLIEANHQLELRIMSLETRISSLATRLAAYVSTTRQSQ